MDSHTPIDGLLKLRRDLEEILAMLSWKPRRSLAVRQKPVPSTSRAELQTLPRVDSPKPQQSPNAERDDLFDDALVVVTEFGEASPTILQMWLSIDYARACRLVSQLVALGLVSSKGRVRHKAYELRRAHRQLSSN